VAATHFEWVDAEYALSEGAGEEILAAGRSFYGVQTGEKGAFRFRLHATGRPGHASLPHDDNCIVKLGRALDRLGSTRLPLHLTQTMRGFMTALAGPADQRAFDLDALFDPDMLGDDLEAWLAESALMKRTFRTCAIIAGLIERRFPGKEKTRRQVTISTDLVYDVLRKHQPGHLLLRAAHDDAATGLLDIRRLGEMLSRVQGRIVHKPLDHVSPLAVPVMLEIGKEQVQGEAPDMLLAEAEALVKEAMQ
jgi:Lhr-like helicase